MVGECTEGKKLSRTELDQITEYFQLKFVEFILRKLSEVTAQVSSFTIIVVKVGQPRPGGTGHGAWRRRDQLRPGGTGHGAWLRHAWATIGLPSSNVNGSQGDASQAQFLSQWLTDTISFAL